MFEHEDNETFWLLPVNETKHKLLRVDDIVISKINEISLN